MSDALASSARLRPAPSAAAPEPLIPKNSFWFFAFLPPLIEVLYLKELWSQPWSYWVMAFASTWTVSCLIGAPLYSAYVYALPRVLLGVTSAFLRGALHVGTVAGSVGLGTALFLPVQPLFCPSYLGGEPRPEGAQLVSILVIGHVICGLFVFAMVSYQSLRRHAREVEQRAEQAARAAVDAQLSALRARTNPHFLFNSLNAAAALTHEDPAKAEETIERLADVFRYALEGSRRSAVPLERELEVVLDYLEIERIRLGARLRFSIDVPPSVRAWPVPPLTVQPLVENAIRHGIAPRTDGGTVTLRAFPDDGGLVIEVEDDGPGPGASTERGSGTSLADLHERLRLLFGGAGQLTTGPASPAAPQPGFRARLHLPPEPAA